MDNKQAMQRLKEHKILFSHDHGWDETTIQALDKAIASLEAWDKVIDEIKERTSQYYLHKPIMFKEDIIHLIEKYKKEIEE